ncbi:hypothetical protein [Azospirillum doebereinerae]
MGKMLREDWRLVGEALLIGRAECLSEKTGKLNNKRFGEWCQTNGFGAVDRSDRNAAVWLAENWEAVVSVVAACNNTNPRVIQAAYKKAVEAAIAAALDEDTAKKALKFHRMIEDDGAAQAETDMAERQLEPFFVAVIVFA